MSVFEHKSNCSKGDSFSAKKRESQLGLRGNGPGNKFGDDLGTVVYHLVLSKENIFSEINKYVRNKKNLTVIYKSGGKGRSLV